MPVNSKNCRTFKTRYRLFMTATERKVIGDADVFSMDDNEEVYGKRFFTMTFKEAIQSASSPTIKS